jgi:hypothetical protein
MAYGKVQSVEPLATGWNILTSLQESVCHFSNVRNLNFPTVQLYCLQGSISSFITALKHPYKLKFPIYIPTVCKGQYLPLLLH